MQKQISQQESLIKGCRLKEAVKARLATAIAVEIVAQVEDGVTNKEEELDKQYTAIKINYKNGVISKV